MTTFFISATIIFIAVNIYYFFATKSYKKNHLNTALFLKLVVVLLSVVIGFAIIYYLLSLNQVIIVQNLQSMVPMNPTFFNFLYFSGETILTVGFGDLIPIGPARFFTIVEAGIGVILPAAYFAQVLNSSNNKED